MGVDVLLVRVTRRTNKNKHGHVEVMDEYYDQHGLFADACESTQSPMLCRVRPFGSVTLRSDDMEQFRRELNQLGGDDAAPFRQKILELAQRCATTPDSELRLDGD